MTKRTEFALRLRQARLAKGMTQTALAELVGMSQSAYGEAETTGNSSTKTAQLAHALGVDPAWLASGEGAPDKRSISGWPFGRVTTDELSQLPPEYLRIVENLTLSLLELQTNVKKVQETSYKCDSGGPVTFRGVRTSPERNYDGTDSQAAEPTDERRTRRGT